MALREVALKPEYSGHLSDQQLLDALDEYVGVYARFGITLEQLDCQEAGAARELDGTLAPVTSSGFILRDCVDSGIDLYGTVHLAHSVFFNVSSDLMAVPLYADDDTKLNLTNVVFLGNRGVLASALYGGEDSTTSAAGLVLHANEQRRLAGSSKTPEGAVYISNACLSNLNDSTSIGNGMPPADELPYVTRGGAVDVECPFALADGCSTNYTNNWFAGNRARLQAGAVHSDTCDRMQFVNNTFIDNKVINNETSTGASRGALLVYPNELTVVHSTFLNNTAGGGSGGAIMVQSSKVALFNTRFEHNKAPGALGGAAMVEAVQVLLHRLFAVNNSAAMGGGIFIESGPDGVLISESWLEDNHADKLGGGLRCVNSLAGTYLQNTTFINNTAPSGGGAALQASVDIEVEDCSFTGNRAAPYQVDASQCSADHPGAGGALCIELLPLPASRLFQATGGDRTNISTGLSFQAWIVNTTFTNSTATNGGAVFYEHVCPPTQDPRSCMRLNMTGEQTRFSGNTALGGAGADIWMSQPDLLDVTCDDGPVRRDALCRAWYPPPPSTPPATGLTSVRPLASSAGRLILQVGLRDGSTQQLVEGDAYPSGDTGLRSSVLVPTRLNITALVTDAYGIPITSGSRDTAIKVAVRVFYGVAGAAFIGSPVVEAQGGVADFTSLSFRAVPGTYTLVFEAENGQGITIDTNISVTIRPCRVGEVASAAGDTCDPCREANQYAFEPYAPGCEQCPAAATCVEGEGESEEYGAVLVPYPGYWHSSPRSGTIHRCPYAPACTPSGDPVDVGARRARVLPLQQTWARRNVTAFTPAQLQQYSDALCLEGHTGNLCAVCQEGYGRASEGKCVKCPDPWVNGLAILAATLVKIFMMGLTISAQLSVFSPAALQAADSEFMEAPTRPLAGPNPPASHLPDLATAGGPPLSGTATQGSPGTGVQLSDGSAVDGLTRRSGGGGATTTVRHSSMGGVGGSDGQYDTTATVHVHLQALVTPGERTLSSWDRPAGAHVGADVAYGQPVTGVVDPTLPTKKLDDLLEQCFAPHSTAIKILVTYLQVLAILSKVSAALPDSVSRLFTAAGVVSSGVRSWVSMDCSLMDTGVPKSVQATVLSVLIPLFAIVGAVAFWSARWYFAWRVRAPDMKLSNYLLRRMVITIITVIFYWYPELADIFLSIFACQELDTSPTVAKYNPGANGNFWESDYGLQCNKGSHLILLLALGIPGLVLVVLGIPLGSALFLRARKSRHRTLSFAATFGFMYADYRESRYAWESVVMLHKAALVAVVVFVSFQLPVFKAVLCLAVIEVTMLAVILLKRFRVRTMEHAERVSQWGSAGTVYLILTYLAMPLNPTVQEAAMFTLLGLNLITILYLSIQVVRQFVYVMMWRLDTDRKGMLLRSDLVTSPSMGLLDKLYLLGTRGLLGLSRALPKWASKWFILYPCEMLMSSSDGFTGPPPPVSVVPSTTNLFVKDEGGQFPPSSTLHHHPATQRV